MTFFGNIFVDDILGNIFGGDIFVYASSYSLPALLLGEEEGF